MAKKPYPSLFAPTIESVVQVLNIICKTRKEDVEDFTNLPNVFIKGRKVNKVPSASTDITGSRPGDFNYDTSYLYICMDNAGTATWRRVAISSW